MRLAFLVVIYLQQVLVHFGGMAWVHQWAFAAVLFTFNLVPFEVLGGIVGHLGIVPLWRTLSAKRLACIFLDQCGSIYRRHCGTCHDPLPSTDPLISATSFLTQVLIILLMSLSLNESTPIRSSPLFLLPLRTLLASVSSFDILCIWLPITIVVLLGGCRGYFLSLRVVCDLGHIVYWL